MKAVVLFEYGDVNQLQFRTDWREPAYAPNEVRVRVRATSINPIDWKLRSGAAQKRMPLNLPAILGRDLAGEVVDIGSDVTGFEKGMRVMALAFGTYAEFAVARADIAARFPYHASRETIPIPILHCEYSFGETLAETKFDLLTYGTFDTVFGKTGFS